MCCLYRICKTKPVAGHWGRPNVWDGFETGKGQAVWGTAWSCVESAGLGCVPCRPGRGSQPPLVSLFKVVSICTSACLQCMMLLSIVGSWCVYPAYRLPLTSLSPALLPFLDIFPYFLAAFLARDVPVSGKDWGVLAACSTDLEPTGVD